MTRKEIEQSVRASISRLQANVSGFVPPDEIEIQYLVDQEENKLRARSLR